MVEQVHPCPKRALVKLVEGFSGSLCVVSVPANYLPHMGPVLLLYMGVIIFFVRAGASKLNVSALTIP